MRPRRRLTPAEEGALFHLGIGLIFLLVLPLIGLPAGVFLWGSLERGLLIFNLAGMILFAIFTRPFWLGERQKKRRRQILFSAGSVTLSTLANVLFDRIDASYALYFAAMCEAFSLIPWITGVTQEIRQGQWQDPRSIPPISYDQRLRQREEEAAPVRRTEEPYEGPEQKPPAAWRIVLPVLLAALGAVGITLWQASGAALPNPEDLRYPSAAQVAQTLEARYGEAFTVDTLYYEGEGLRTWWASPENDPGLRFTVATGPAAAEEEESGSPLPKAVVGPDNYRQHAWNARVVPVFQAYGMAALCLRLSPEHLRKGTGGGLLLPEPFGSALPGVYTGSVLVGWYELPAAYWALDEAGWPQDAQTIAALLEELREIAPFARLGCYWTDTQDSLNTFSWPDWVLPVAVGNGFIGLPIPKAYTPEEIRAVLAQARPDSYYYIEDGFLCRPSHFDPAPPVPLDWTPD